MPPKDPRRPEQRPLPEKPPPFDLDALRGISKPETRKLRWRRGKGLPELEEAAPTVITPRSSVALLALIPTAGQCAAIRAALADADVPYAVPIRLTLRNGLSMQDEAGWRPAIESVTQTRRPFTVRLGPPELRGNRLVCLMPVGDAVSDLQHALNLSLGAAGYLPHAGDVAQPLVLLAGTFTGLNLSQLHELVNVVTDRVTFPMDFRATALYTVAEASDADDLPMDAFPFAGPVTG